MSEELKDRWQKVLEEKGNAERRAGRIHGSVRLIAVSKFHPASDISALYDLGQRDFGENYMQEARSKQQELAGLDINWHAIGAVQTNKAKDVAGHFCLLHTLASESLARAILHRLPDGVTQDVLLQVNIGKEEQKSGVLPENLPYLIELLLKSGLVSENGEGLHLRGLMCLPPRCGEGELARPFFVQMRELRDSMSSQFGLSLPELSMGMSGDFQQAIEEGATMIRVGTEIFGIRPTRLN
jgi:hypothetical protein